MCDKNVELQLKNAGIIAALMPILISKYWRRSYISPVVHETDRGMEMRKNQQLVHIKKVLGKTKSSSEKKVPGIIAGKKTPQSLHYFMYLSTSFFTKKNPKPNH